LLSALQSNTFIIGTIRSDALVSTLPNVDMFAFSLLVAWTSIELIRFPFYIAHVLKKSIPWLIWLRYNAWIVLYPLGMVCEVAVLFAALPSIYHVYSPRLYYAW
jgi:hypothetical protein